MKNLFLYFLVVAAVACQKEVRTELKKTQAARVKVQHILIAFKGSLPGKDVERSRADAKKLAMELLKRSETENFENLVTAYSDDMVPGVYQLANQGVEPEKDEFPRSYFKSGFGDLAFQLEPGEIQILEYDSESSPYGYHLIKRLE